MRLLILVATLAVTTLIAIPQANAYTNVIHSYELLIKDINEQPVEGAAVSFSTYIKDQPGSTKIECVTDAKGICKAEIEVAPKCNPRTKTFVTMPMSCGTVSDDAAKGYVHVYSEDYKSSVSYSVGKEGFYSNSGKLTSSYGSKYSYTKENPVTDSVVLYKPVDYLSEVFIDRKLREQALKFISLIRRQSLIVDADIMLRSTGTSTFKEKKYFQMKINTTTTFNSLKLDKYGIAKRLFDDSIRKILSPLNDNISNPKSFYGYDLIIYGYTKSFADEDASPEKIEYRFLIPQNTVKRYKDKDISGQQLLDASVILMNDERIELKLQ